jgi:hypothetical protein
MFSFILNRSFLFLILKKKRQADKTARRFGVGFMCAERRYFATIGAKAPGRAHSTGNARCISAHSF